MWMQTNFYYFTFKRKLWRKRRELGRKKSIAQYLHRNMKQNRSVWDKICETICCYGKVRNTSFKNDVKWGTLVTHFDNIFANYPLKQWWRASFMNFLPDSKIPEGVFEIGMKCVILSWFRRLGKLETKPRSLVVRILKFVYCTLVPGLKKRQRRL